MPGRSCRGLLLNQRHGDVIVDASIPTYPNLYRPGTRRPRYLMPHVGTLGILEPVPECDCIAGSRALKRRLMNQVPRQHRRSTWTPRLGHQCALGHTDRLDVAPGCVSTRGRSLCDVEAVRRKRVTSTEYFVPGDRPCSPSSSFPASQPAPAGRGRQHVAGACQFAQRLPSFLWRPNPRRHFTCRLTAPKR